MISARVGILQWIGVWTLLGMGAAGCGSNQKIGSQPSWRTSEFRASSGVSTASDEIHFYPKSRAATHYNAKRKVWPRVSPESRQVVRALERRAALLGIQLPPEDARLSQVAQDLAEVMPADGPPPYQMIEFTMHRQGLLEPSPLTIVVREMRDPDGIARELLVATQDVLSGEKSYSRMGVGTTALGSNRRKVTVFALQESHVVTQPIARRINEPGIVPVEGYVLPPYRDPRIHVTNDSGRVTDLAVSLKHRRTFRALFSCSQKRGRQQIEIVAEDRSGTTVLANFPVWCNVQPETAIVVSVSDHDAVSSAEFAEERLAQLVNDERIRHGLPVLQLDERISRVARAHSREMLATRTVAHVSPKTGAATDRMQRARIATSAVMENVARAYGIGETHKGLMNSPGHRSNVLSNLATHMGIGVVLGQDVAGRRELFVTQLFVRVPPRLELGEVRQRLAQRVQRSHNVKYDVRLTALASEYAKDIASGIAPGIASSQGKERRFALEQTFAKLTTMTTTVTDIEAFDLVNNIASDEMSHYGLGVAKGSHPKLGGEAIHIVLILAEQR